LFDSIRYYLNMSNGNGYKLAAQMTKAWKLAARLRAHDISADEAKGITTEQWALLARAIDINPPSAETIEMVIGYLQPVNEDELFARMGD